MRVLLALILALGAGLLPAFGQLPAERLCTAENSEGCGVSQQDLKHAERAFSRAMKLKDRRPDEAFAALEEAARLVPRNVDYVTAREMLRQQFVLRHVERGNALAAEQRTVEARAEYQAALKLDPANEFAAQQLRELAPTVPRAPSFVDLAPPLETVQVRPKPVRLDFNQTADAQAVLNTVIRAYGLQPTVDPTVLHRRVHFEAKQVDFYEAMETLGALTNTFWVASSPTTLTVAGDTAPAHKQFDHWTMRTFYLPEASSAQDLTDVSNVLRTVLDLRFVSQQPASSSITVRGPAPAVEAATRLLESMQAGRPEVMLDIDVFQISRQLARALGVDLPLQFSIFNIPAAALAALGGTDIQSLINQLIASGGINQANSSALSGLLAQVQSQQNSLFKNPVATFGGGKTLMGIGIPPATATLSLNESKITTLDHISMRAAHGNAATFRLGSRQPILNSIYAPVYNTPQISGVIGGGSYVAPFPSFNYEDLGVTVKAKPMVHGTTEVTLELEMDIRSLTSANFNGVPVISQRSYKGAITAPNGEPIALAGYIAASEQDSLQGPPGLANIPGNIFTNSQNKQHTEDELLIVITPYIVRAPEGANTPVIRAPVSER